MRLVPVHAIVMLVVIAQFFPLPTEEDWGEGLIAISIIVASAYYATILLLFLLPPRRPEPIRAHWVK